MTEFKIGDRVMVHEDCPDPPNNRPGVGTVKGFEQGHTKRCAVEFDDLRSGHECAAFDEEDWLGKKPVSLCNHKKGWWVHSQYLVPYSPLWAAVGKYINKEFQS